MIRRLKEHWPLVLAALLFLLCALSAWRLHAVGALLDSQRAAERWRGESEREFAQISCFAAPSELLSLEQLMSFRGAMAQKLKDASFDLEKETGLYTDAWSTEVKVTVSAGRRSGEVQAVAVGGSFFDFHPVRLLSGSYLSADDLMEDRVLLDRETAWLLFGGTELSGMSFSLNGVPVVVSGVYAHADDSFSRKAEEGAMRIYIHYALYEKLFPEKTGIACYEFVMANPVKGFARGAAEEKFPLKSAEIVENSSRFETAKLWALLRSRGTRSMRKTAAAYPTWENAARAAEDRAVLWLLGAIVFGIFPSLLIAFDLVRYTRRGRARFENDLLPEARERLREAVRVRARARWVRKHPDMK